MGRSIRPDLSRHLDVLSLRLFVSAVREQQIGLAAAREHMAPSTATKRIQMLEELVGLPLLERGRHGVVPTEAGEVMMRRARAVLDEIEGLHADLAQLTALAEGKLVVAAAHSTIADLLAPALAVFAAGSPAVELELRELDNSEVVDQVSSGACDVGVFATVGDLVPDQSRGRVLRSDELVAVLPARHRLGDREALTYQDLIGQDLIVTHTLLLAFEELSRGSGRRPNLRHVVRTGEVALGMVHSGLGLTLVPKQLALRVADTGMLVKTIDEPWSVRRIRAATGHGKTPTPAVSTFVNTLITTIPGQNA